jgi:hypothetical protein
MQADPKVSSVSRPFIERPVATTLLMLALLVSGILSYRLLPVAALPQASGTPYSLRRLMALPQGAKYTILLCWGFSATQTLLISESHIIQ